MSAPFNYFRPLPKIFFLLMSNAFNDSFVAFRIAVIILHIICSILVYKFSLSLNFSNTSSFIAAIIFSVLSCHSESLFFINCVNEIFSAVFILTGLYWYSKYDSVKYTFLIIISFLFALLSRESAICYIPLVFLVKFKTGNRSWKDTLIVLLIPILLYIAFRIFSEIHFGGTGERLVFDSLDLNPVKVIYKMFHYFINMIFPVKSLFEFVGFNSLEILVNAFKRPSENLPVFLGLSICVSVICGAMILLFMKTLKKEMIFPLLFIMFSLAIYLFSFNTAERFLYLPSTGLSILLGMFFSKLNPRKALFTFVILFLIIHSASLVFRSYRHKQAATYSGEAIKNLFGKTIDVKSGSDIFLENIPPKKFGIFFLSPYNFQSNWDYNYPDKKINFLFNETIKPDDKNNIDAVYRFNDDQSSFERVN